MNILLNEAQMPSFGQQLGLACSKGSVIFLEGTLGMGKTTLSRTLVQGLGWTENVKSPTYTLVEHYDLPAAQIYHFDLYRLSDPEELEFMGIRDIDAHTAIWLVEWPDKGKGFLPEADLIVTITAANDEMVRALNISAQTEKGREQVSELSQNWEGAA